MNSCVKKIADSLEEMGREFILEVCGIFKKSEVLEDVHAYDDGETVFIQDYSGEESTLELKERDIVDVNITGEFIKIELIGNTYINFVIV